LRGSALLRARVRESNAGAMFCVSQNREAGSRPRRTKVNRES
jgi:hypothetical protein